MKVLVNKKTKIRGQNGKFLDYKKLIIDCLDNPQISPTTGQSMGFSRSMMNDRNRIEKVVEDSDIQMIFEDNDATNLKNIVNVMRWASRHDDFETFMDAVDDMKVYKLPKEKKEDGEKEAGEAEENEPESEAAGSEPASETAAD